MGAFMQSELFRQYVMANVGGAAQPNANAQVLSNATILVPPDGLLANFSGFVEGIFEQVEVLVAQIERLRAARDLLLPRLMDGRLSV
jgi:type I restriction enzyme S subunit